MNSGARGTIGDLGETADLLHLAHVHPVLLAVEVERDEVLGRLGRGTVLLRGRGEEREAVPAGVRACAEAAAAGAGTARQVDARPAPRISSAGPRRAARSGHRRVPRPGSRGRRARPALRAVAGCPRRVPRRQARWVAAAGGRRRRIQPRPARPGTPAPQPAAARGARPGPSSRRARFRASAIRPMLLPSRLRVRGAFEVPLGRDGLDDRSVHLRRARAPCPRAVPASRGGSARAGSRTTAACSRSTAAAVKISRPAPRRPPVGARRRRAYRSAPAACSWNEAPMRCVSAR